MANRRATAFRISTCGRRSPYVQDDAHLTAAAYFYLGYDNYALAGELADKGRAIDAVKFSKLLREHGFAVPLTGAQESGSRYDNEYNVE